MLPRFLEKLFAQNLRTVVRVQSPERLAVLDNLLWTYHPSSFLPHGVKEPEEQPIWLTDMCDESAGFQALVLLDGVENATLKGYEKCFYFFDGNDPIASRKAKGYWNHLKKNSNNLRFWTQTEKGAWKSEVDFQGES